MPRTAWAMGQAIVATLLLAAPAWSGTTTVTTEDSLNPNSISVLGSEDANDLTVGVESGTFNLVFSDANDELVGVGSCTDVGGDVVECPTGGESGLMVFLNGGADTYTFDNA